jgi:hypothetical protein
VAFGAYERSARPSSSPSLPSSRSIPPSRPTMDPPSPLTYHCALCQDRPSTYPSLGELHLHFRLWHPEQADDLQAAYAQSLASRAPQLLKVLEQAAQKTTTNSTSFAVQPCSSSTETSSVGGAGPSVERVLPTPLNPARPVHRPSPAASLTQDPARRLADAPQAGTLSVSVPPAPPMKEGPRVNDSRRRLSPSEYGPPPRPPPPSPPPPPSTQPRAEMPAPNGSAHDLLCRKCPAGPGSKWFRTQSALEEHSRDTHRTGSAPTGSRPPASFACKLCPLSGQATKTFASEVVLIQHQETSHRQIQNRLTPSSRPSGLSTSSPFRASMATDVLHALQQDRSMPRLSRSSPATAACSARTTGSSRTRPRSKTTAFTSTSRLSNCAWRMAIVRLSLHLANFSLLFASPRLLFLCLFSSLLSSAAPSQTSRSISAAELKISFVRTARSLRITTRSLSCDTSRRRAVGIVESPPKPRPQQRTSNLVNRPREARVPSGTTACSKTERSTTTTARMRHLARRTSDRLTLRRRRTDDRLLLRLTTGVAPRLMVIEGGKETTDESPPLATPHDVSTMEGAPASLPLHHVTSETDREIGTASSGYLDLPRGREGLPLHALGGKRMPRAGSTGRQPSRGRPKPHRGSRRASGQRCRRWRTC